MNRLIVCVSGFEKDGGPTPAKKLHRPGTVHLGDDNIAVTGLDATLDQEQLA